MDAKQVDVMVADASHEVYVDKILDTIREAAKVRGTGIAERTHEYVTTKIVAIELPSQVFIQAEFITFLYSTFFCAIVKTLASTTQTYPLIFCLIYLHISLSIFVLSNSIFTLKTFISIPHFF